MNLNDFPVCNCKAQSLGTCNLLLPQLQKYSQFRRWQDSNQIQLFRSESTFSSLSLVMSSMILFVPSPLWRLWDFRQFLLLLGFVEQLFLPSSLGCSLFGTAFGSFLEPKDSFDSQACWTIHQRREGQTFVESVHFVLRKKKEQQQQLQAAVEAVKESPKLYNSTAGIYGGDTQENHNRPTNTCGVELLRLEEWQPRFRKVLLRMPPVGSVGKRPHFRIVNGMHEVD